MTRAMIAPITPPAIAPALEPPDSGVSPDGGGLGVSTKNKTKTKSYHRNIKRFLSYREKSRKSIVSISQKKLS